MCGRQRIGEAIDVIESRRMPAPAKTPPGTARHLGLLGVHREYLDFGPVQPQIEFSSSGITKRASMTMTASSHVAADMSRTGSLTILPSNAGASGSSNKMA